MSNVINTYYDDTVGKDVVYGYVDEVAIVEQSVLDEWRAEKKRREAAERGPIKHYVNCYHAPIAELNNVLSVDELGAAMKLIPYLRMHTEGHLYYGSKRMDATLIARAIGKQLRQTRTITASLLMHGVLFREKVGRAYVYGVNERYHSMGSVMKGALYTKLYQIQTREDIPEISIQAAGVLYKMLPFFNYAHYFLSENPDEADASKLRHLSHRRFSEMVNVDRSVIDSGMRELRRYGFIMSIDSYGGQMYRINPDVMSRRKNVYDEQTERIREDFAQARRNVEQNGLDELPY